MSVVGPSRHFAAMRNLIATGAQRNLASRQLRLDDPNRRNFSRADWIYGSDAMAHAAENSFFSRSDEFLHEIRERTA
jgi:hypothetical protein